MNVAAYREPYQLPAGILAIAVHGVFFALIIIGMEWQALPPAAMSVELWSNLPETIAEPPAQPATEELALPPQTATKPDTVEAQPEKAIEPEIALPDKKKQPPKKPEKIKPRPTNKTAAKPDSQGIATRMAEQFAREQAERTTRERAAQDAAVIGRMVDEYTGRIVNKIRRNIVMPPDVANDARAEFLVTLLPGGTVLSARLTRPSGNAAYDSAVERAILKSQPLPLPPDTAMFKKFRDLKLVFKPME